MKYTRITVAPSIGIKDDIHRSVVEGGWNARQRESYYEEGRRLSIDLGRVIF